MTMWTWAAWLGAAGAVAPARAEEPVAEVAIPFEHYTLDNGLEVILSEDHSVPFVWVNIWYHVGSKDEHTLASGEGPGRTGFAHLFEHLMFQGSAHMNDDYFVPLQAIGARINGSTSFDRTNYFEGVPAEHLPLALWLESDRMGWLLPALDQQKLDNQKDVVRNERRQRYENQPYGMVWVWLFENLYPPDHPYHVPTIGRHEDIEAATLEDVKSFFRTWYLPNNATLSIVGDFDPAEAKALVERYFGDIPAGPEPTPATADPVSLDAEKVVRKTDDVPNPKVWIAWLTPKLYAPGDAELDVLSEVLTGGKDSRLTRELVYERRIAKDVEAYQYSAVLQSQYFIEATAAPGHTTDELVEAIDEILDELRRDGPTDEEVEVAVTNWEVGFWNSLQSIAGKADRLNAYAVQAGDPGFIGQDLARYVGVTADGVHEVLREWLPPDRRVVLHVVPADASTDTAPQGGE